MSTQTLAASDYIETMKQLYSTTDEMFQHYKEIADLYKRKLWHQLTQKLERFIVLPRFNHGRELIELYERFIRDFETRINQLKFVHMIRIISRQFQDINEAIKFQEEIALKVASHKEAHILIRSVLADNLLQAGRQNDCKALLDQLKVELEGITGIDSTVYEWFYKTSWHYYKSVVMPAEFYRSALTYLAYIPIESLSESEKVQLAFDLGLAALVGENIYNFGELLAHPILESLNNTDNHWMILLLHAFNSGNIDQYDALVSQHKSQLEAQVVLANNTQLLKRKIAILALMELVFSRPSEARQIPFSVISATTKIPIDQVEILVMKALCLKVVKGVIDEVEQFVHFTWVQPRVLSLDQTAHMRDKLKSWAATVQKMRNNMEDQTAELFS